jgi:cob(I)alamin adenosyltransferase
MKAAVLPFIKILATAYGGQIALERLGAQSVGFTGTRTPEKHRVALQVAWRTAE